MVSEQGWIPFEGLRNFRDLGGYPTRSGRQVRRGVVFRAGVLDPFSSADRARFDELGVRTVFDLRSDAECAARPATVPARRLSIAAAPSSGPTPRSARESEERLRDVYCGLLDESAAQIGELLVSLLDGDALPAVIHCHTGKDRTGIVAAVLLEALGVDRELVLDDYESTMRYVQRDDNAPTFERLLSVGYTQEAAAAALTAPRWAMADALAHLDAEHGGIETYLLGPAGVRRDHVEALRERLLEPQPANAQ